MEKDDRHPTTSREQTRHLEEAQLRSIIERLADGIVIIGENGVIRYANAAADRLFARSARDLVGTDFGFPSVSGELAEINLVRPGKEPIAAELRVVEIAWEGERASLVSIRDITDRRRAEERARQLEREQAARAEAEAANKAKSEFLAIMSHELRTPLNAIIGYAELVGLGIGGRLSSEQQQQMSRILASARHLLGLVTDILDLAKVDTGRLVVHAAPASARATADAAAALVQPSAEERGVRFAIISSGDERVYYEGDEDRVRQILVNLLTNAVKFTDAGGLVSLEYGPTTEPDAETRLRPGGASIYFKVSDTGIGVPTEQLARIFEPFVQVASGHTRSTDGSGLGLAISRRLARLMHGDITVRSEVGKGSVFTLWLPSVEYLTRESSAHEAPAAAAVAPPHGLADVGEILMRELPPLLEAFVARLRAECPAAGVAVLKFSQLADHVAGYLADLAGMLVALDEAGGRPSSVLVDATEIHRVVAARHGAQRAALGWTEEAIRCEYRILWGEIERVVRERAESIDAPAIEEALEVAARLVEQAEETSILAFERVTGAGEGSRPAHDGARA